MHSKLAGLVAVVLSACAGQVSGGAVDTVERLGFAAYAGETQEAPATVEVVKAGGVCTLPETVDVSGLEGVDTSELRAALDLVCAATGGDWCPEASDKSRVRVMWFEDADYEYQTWALEPGSGRVVSDCETCFIAGRAIQTNYTGRVAMNPNEAYDFAAVLSHELFHIGGVDHDENSEMMRAMDATYPEDVSYEVTLWAEARAKVEALCK